MTAVVDGVASEPRTDRSDDRWYVTSPATESRFVAGDMVVRPVAIAHAKQMGTVTTACGLWSYSWRGMLELSFPLAPKAAPGVDMCPDCLERVNGTNR